VFENGRENFGDFLFVKRRPENCLCLTVLRHLSANVIGMERPIDKSKTNQFSKLRRLCYILQQVAQLSQKDRAAGWVSFGQSGRLEQGDNILRTL